MSFKEFTIDNCCYILNNLRFPINSEQRFEMKGEYPYYGANGVQDYINKWKFDDDLILIAEDGGNFEQYSFKPIAYRVKGKCWVNNHAHVLKAKEDFSQGFIFYSLEHKNILFFIAGGTRSKLTQIELKKITLNIPLKNEAERIREILEATDEAIAHTEALIAKYQRIKTGLMQDLLTKGIDENGTIRSKETHKFVIKNGIEVPEEWEVDIIDNVSKVTKLAGYEFTKYFDYSIGGEIIALRALNIKNEEIILNDIQTIPKKVSDQLPRSKINKGDVLITYIGAYIGDTLLITESDKYHLAPNIAKLTAGNKLTPEFLEIVLKTYPVQKQTKNLTAVTATPSLTMGQIRNISISFPIEIEEQKRIITTINSIRHNLKDEQNKLHKLQSLKTGLMQDLLSGKVRVNIE